MNEKHKAQLLYRWQHGDCDVLSDVPPDPKDRFAMSVTVVSWVIPATPEAYDAQRNAMAKAWFQRSGPWVNGAGNSMAWTEAHQEPWLRGAELALAAIGITRPKERKQP